MNLKKILLNNINAEKVTIILFVVTLITVLFYH